MAKSAKSQHIEIWRFKAPLSAFSFRGCHDTDRGLKASYARNLGEFSTTWHSRRRSLSFSTLFCPLFPALFGASRGRNPSYGVPGRYCSFPSGTCGFVRRRVSCCGTEKGFQHSLFLSRLTGREGQNPFRALFPSLKNRPKLSCSAPQFQG